jgi:heme/copper-type cytochrome/quinol oxidase subunit 4
VGYFLLILIVQLILLYGFTEAGNFTAYVILFFLIIGEMITAVVYVWSSESRTNEYAWMFFVLFIIQLILHYYYKKKGYGDLEELILKILMWGEVIVYIILVPVLEYR